jgi:hypothetical protein
MMVQITREQFDKFEDVYESGMVNLDDTLNLATISGLDKEVVEQISGHYKIYLKKFRGVKNVMSMSRV